MVGAKIQTIWGKVWGKNFWGKVGARLGHGWGMAGAKAEITWGKVGA